MTDTAKPTPGPWYYVPYPAGIGGFVNAGDPSGPAICDLSKYEHPEINGRFIAEAGSVFHETNLTPRQLMEQRDELAELLESYLRILRHYMLALKDDEQMIENCQFDGKQALVKCGKVGG